MTVNFKNSQSKLLGLMLILSTGFTTACSSLLYYPNSVTYARPDMGGIEYEDIVFPTHNDNKLHGWYMKSKNPRALAVFFHGNGGNISSHFMMATWLLAANIDVFVFDYQGYGLSEGKPSPKETVRDGQAAILWAKNYLKDNQMNVPLMVFGHSLGGAIAMKSVLELKGQVPIKLMLVGSTFHSYKEVGRKVMNNQWFLWPFQWMSYLVLSDRWAPDDDIKNISPIPMIVFHGDQDNIVVPELGDRVFELARDPKIFIGLKNSGHNNVFHVNEGANTKKLIKAVNKYL